MLYGSALPLMLTIERNTLSNMKRFSPNQSNSHGLKVALGSYDKIEFQDFLGKNKTFDVDESLFRKIEYAYGLN